jgi:RNA polymerase sigma factor (TIGR02999 family)
LSGILLAPLVYQELRTIARRLLARERPGHTLQPTELLHGAFIKLAQQDRVDWKGRTHFFAVGAHHMRRILVSHARKKLSAKRSQALYRVELTENMMLTPQRQQDVLAIDEAIEKLKELDERQPSLAIPPTNS